MSRWDLGRATALLVSSAFVVLMSFVPFGAVLVFSGSAIAQAPPPPPPPSDDGMGSAETQLTYRIEGHRVQIPIPDPIRSAINFDAVEVISLNDKSIAFHVLADRFEIEIRIEDLNEALAAEKLSIRIESQGHDPVTALLAAEGDGPLGPTDSVAPPGSACDSFFKTAESGHYTFALTPTTRDLSNSTTFSVNVSYRPIEALVDQCGQQFSSSRESQIDLTVSGTTLIAEDVSIPLVDGSSTTYQGTSDDRTITVELQFDGDAVAGTISLDGEPGTPTAGPGAAPTEPLSPRLLDLLRSATDKASASPDLTADISASLEGLTDVDLSYLRWALQVEDFTTPSEHSVRQFNDAINVAVLIGTFSLTDFSQPLARCWR